MAVYYKFKSAKDYDSIPMDGHFMSVANLKERIFESKHLGRGTDFDLVVTNAQTNEEYLDEAMLIPKNTSVLIRRVPGRPRMPIVAQPDELVETKADESQPTNNNAMAVDSFILKDLEASEWDDDFGNDLYTTIPEIKPAQVNNQIQDAPAPTKDDEDSKIRALIETPALDWQRQAEGYGSGRGSGRAGRILGGRGIGRGILERKTPPQGYVCHRCKVPGHFIQHCPTNGDSNYDIRRAKPPTGIPKSMLMATPDGSYALPSGASAVLRPNEAAFEKEIEGLPTSRPVGDVPPELRCPLCKDVMKDAVLTSKCCFTSFCDKCIRDHIMSKSMCVCGARDVLADDLLPNRTLRNTINGILEAKDVSGENAGSGIQVPDMESARPKAPSPTLSAASRGEQMQPPPPVKDTSKTMETAIEERPSGPSPPGQPQLQSNQPTAEGVRTVKIPDVSEATRESGAREAASQGSAPPHVDDEVQQKMAAAEGKKKKKKKARLPLNAMPMEAQWRNPQEFAAENYMMQMGPGPYKPYWDGMQPGMESYMAPFPPCPMPYNNMGNMGFGMGPMDVPFGGGVFHHDPFMAQNLMYPPPPFVRPPPQRDLADFGMGFNPRPPPMSREEFEARQADLRRKREMERMGDSREMPVNMMMLRDRDRGREVSSSANGPPAKPKLVNRGPAEREHDQRHQDDGPPNRQNRGGGGSVGHRSDRISPGRRPDRTSPQRSGPRSDRISPGHRPDRTSPQRGGHRPDRTSPQRGGHRSDRISPEHSRPDPDHLSRKRKSSSDYRSTTGHRRSPSIDAFDHRDHRDSSEHNHQRRPRSSSKPPSAAPEQAPSHPHTTHKSSTSTEDKQHKKSVFSRISFPEGGADPASKKRKTSSEPKSSSSKPAGSSSHATMSNGYAKDASPVITRKSQQIHNNYTEEVDYESSDDDRHFKRRPSRYEPSPPAPPRMGEAVGEMDVGGKRSKRDRDRGGHNSRHRS